MSRSTFTVEETGKTFPKQYKRFANGLNKRRSKFVKKFFGWRKGDGSVPNAVKNEDYINYGYPFDVRPKNVIKQHIQDEVTKEQLKEI